ncbi:hypothetical protein SEVIR_8G004176v4 [Setaria viridis]|uniref:Uncharacterized protein n=1 Tax=Setaria viridis TaxID=4556 RepID=A0A4U6TA96_SETVI|nr:hypothetical protein SEVIR_8G004176v2 [Setaria viridis]
MVELLLLLLNIFLSFSSTMACHLFFCPLLDLAEISLFVLIVEKKIHVVFGIRIIFNFDPQKVS